MRSVAEVHITLVKDRELEYKAFRASDQAAELGHQLIKQNDREHLIVLSLNGQNKPINVNIVHVGSSDQCNTSSKEILKPAILSNAASILILHNHPSGDVTPSNGDRIFTERMKSASEVMGIRFLDSVIISEPGKPFYSLAEERIMGEVTEK